MSKSKSAKIAWKDRPLSYRIFRTILSVLIFLCFIVALLAFPGVNIANTVVNKFYHQNITCTVESSKLTAQSGSGNVSATTKSIYIRTKECGLVVMSNTHENRSLQEVSDALNNNKGNKVEMQVGGWQLHKNEHTAYRIKI